MAASVAVLILFVGVGLLTGATQDDPGPGAFRFDYGRQTVTGVLELRPYPLLYVTEGSERVKAGQTLMLSAAGKRGLMGRAEPLAGVMVTASGVILDRGELEMLQVRGGKAGLGSADGNGSIPEPVSLGRWRLAGEICDGKCLAGAMRPGTGLAHKACANLCLIGGVPPVFVSSQPVEGSEFLLIAGPDGGPLPDSVHDQVGLFVSVEGVIERRGDLLVFRIDPDSIEALCWVGGYSGLFLRRPLESLSSTSLDSGFLISGGARACSTSLRCRQGAIYWPAGCAALPSRHSSWSFGLSFRS